MRRFVLAILVAGCHAAPPTLRPPSPPPPPPTTEPAAATPPASSDARPDEPELTDEQLAVLAAEQARMEYLSWFPSPYTCTVIRTPVGTSVDDDRDDEEQLDPASTNRGPLLDSKRSWGEASPQRPSIILDRDRTPYAPPGRD